MYISRRMFYFVSILFLLLPFSVNWRLFVFGKQTTGFVVRVQRPIMGMQQSDSYSIIEFYTPEKTIEVFSPENVIYPVGKKLRIFYNPENPDNNILFTFTGLFFNKKAIFPFVFFMIWMAFYSSFAKKGNPNANQNQSARYLSRKSLK